MPLASSFDTVGWFARDPATLRRVGEVLLEEPVTAAEVPAGLLVASDAFALAGPGVEARLTPLVERLEARLGQAERVTVSEPGGGFPQWMLHFRHIQAREIAAQHRAWIEAAQPAFGPEIAERFTWALGVDAALGEAGTVARRDLTGRLDALLAGGKLLCLPTAQGIAPRLDASVEDLVEHRGRTLGLTAMAGLAGLPQITLPLAELEGCPLGISLIGPRGGDMMLLAFAEAFLAEVP